MSKNIFDQFVDEPQSGGNMFDQFVDDGPNMFDQFDSAPQGFPSTPPAGFPVPQKRAKLEFFEPSEPSEESPVQKSKNRFDLKAAIHSIPVVKKFDERTDAYRRLGDQNPELAAGIDTAGSFVAGIPGGVLEMGDALMAGADPLFWAKTMGAPIPFDHPSASKAFHDNLQPSVEEGYDLGSLFGQAVVPTGTGAAAPTIKTALKSGAFAGGVSSLLGDMGGQLRKKGEVNPVESALSGLVGTGVGGLLGGAGHIAGDVLKKLLGRKPPPPTPEPIPEPPWTYDSLPEQRRSESVAMGASSKSSGRATNILAELGIPQVAPRELLPPVEPQGLFRHQREAFGRNKVDLAPESSGFDPEVQAAVNEIATNKAKVDAFKAQMEDSASKVWQKLQASGLVPPEGPGSYEGLVRAETRRSERLPAHIEQELSKFREMLAGGVDRETSKQHVSAMLGSNFGEHGPKVPSTSFDTAEEGLKLVGQISKQLSEAEKIFKSVKEQHFPTLQKAQAGMRETNPTASFQARTRVQTPFGDEVDALVSLDYNRMQLKLSEDAEKIYKQAQSEAIQKAALDRNKIPKYGYKMDARWAKKHATKALGAFSIGLLAQPGAQAADGSKQQEDESNWIPAAKIAGGVALFTAFAPSLARKLVTKDILKSSLLWNDTVQRISALDDVMGTKIAASIWKHIGAVHNSSFGVEVPQDVRAQAMDLIRSGKFTSHDIQYRTQKTQGTVFDGMSPQQQKAFHAYAEVQENLKALLSNHLEDARNHIANLQRQGQNTHMIEQQLDAVQDMLQVFEPRRAQGGEKFWRTGLANFYDYHFFFNPAFHLTNLSDMVIAGGTRVGPMNITKAIHELGPMGNANLKKLFKNSNLAGGLEAEKLANAAVLGKKPKGFQLTDFKSDKANADRVALGSIFQYASGRAKANGWTGSDTEFAEKLLKGSLSAEMAADAWAHVAETLSRTLGADPYRINNDIFNSMPMAPAIAAFTKQPMRIANMAMHYLAEGDLKKFYMMMGLTAMVGGRAAIPKDAQAYWENWDPESYFLAAAVLDKMEVLQYMTGKTLSGKVQWSLVPPLAAFMGGGGDPVGSTIKENTKAVSEMGVDALNWAQSMKDKDAVQVATDLLDWGNWDDPEGRNKFYTKMGRALTLLKPRIFGLPSKQILNGAKGADQAFVQQSIPLHYYDTYGTRMAQKDEMALSDLGLSSPAYFVGQFTPGEQSSVVRGKMQKIEQIKRDKRSQPGQSWGLKNDFSWFGNNAYQNDATNDILRGLGI